MTLTILAVDDEPLARRKLADLIAQVPWATQVGEAADGEAALEAVRTLRPDVVLLDIQMPELSGISVVEHLAGLDPAPAVVFTTAFDEYAVRAFELEAVDYLLKPFGMRRFLAALERARAAVQNRSGAAALQRAHRALERGAPAQRIFVRDGNAILPLALAEIERIEALDDYVLIHARGRHFIVSLRLGQLEDWLPNPPFLRIHRSHIVNLDHVERMEGLDDDRLNVQMKSGISIRASRARSREIRRRSR